MSAEHRVGKPQADPAVRPGLEAVGLDRPGPLPGEPGPPAELGEVARLWVELARGLGGHRAEGLVYNLLKAIVFVIHPSVLLSPARRQRKHRGRVEDTVADFIRPELVDLI